MIVETIRMVADALATGSYGVNTQLASLPLDTGDTVPANVVTIADETRDDEVAVGRFPSSLPALVVTLDGNPTLQGDVVSGIRDGTISVVIRYLTTDVESSKSVTDTYNTLRAVARTMKTFNSNAQSAARSRNDVQIIECLGIEVTQTFKQIDDANNTGAVRVQFRVRDVAP